MHIHAWLEEREIRGMPPAFRGRLSSSTAAAPVGVGSLDELHLSLDRTLRDARLIEDNDEGEG